MRFERFLGALFFVVENVEVCKNQATSLLLRHQIKKKEISSFPDLFMNIHRNSGMKKNETRDIVLDADLLHSCS
jgi:hypothetical protein